MAQGISSGSQTRNYGATDSSVPGIAFQGVQFSPTEYYNLSENITSNIYSINSMWKNLDSDYKIIGTEKDNQAFRDNVHVTLMSCNQKINQISKDFQRLQIIVKKGDKQQKLQVEKLTNSFKEAMDCYANRQRKVAEIMKTNLLPTNLMKKAYEEREDDNENRYIANIHAMEAQKKIQRDLEFEQGLLLEREQSVRKIEAVIIDVNQIMKEVIAGTYEQGMQINIIENNIENVDINVEYANQELEKADTYQNKYRTKICILLVIALVVGIIITIIIITTVKS